MKSHSIFDDKTLAFFLLLPSVLLFADIPLWAFASAMIFWFYRMIVDRLGWRIPSRFITGFFSLVFLGITYFTFKTMIGRDPACAFLTVLLSLKILEYRNPSERAFPILLGFYLLTSKFLYSTDLVWFSMAFPSMVLLIYYLLPDVYRKRFPRSAGLHVLKSIVLSSPLALFLFFYFPRFSSNLFNFKTDPQRQGQVGFADDVHPGSVSSLAETDEIAFRAEFLNLKPTINSLYWRGLTLTRPDGLRWQRDLQLDPARPRTTILPSVQSQVRVVLEPHYKEWIFTLDQTTSARSDQYSILGSPLGVYKVSNLVNQRIVYETTSLQGLTRPQHPEEKPILMKNPIDPELQPLLRQLIKGRPTPGIVVDRISDYFVQKHFKYTINTGDSDTLTLADFLLRTQKGFCEHFASSAALLLNAVKIPARVIIGYHGGEYNPIGRFWTIRQRDAHAWVEYLDENKLWHRYDPTAVVAPMRLSLGAALFAQFREDTMTQEQFKALALAAQQQSIFDQIRYQMDELNFRWNSALINYDIDRQKEFLREMDINLGTAILLGMLVALLLSLMMSWLFRVRHKQSRSQRILNAINRDLAPLYLERFPTEGPLAWKTRLQKALPDYAPEMAQLIDYYIIETYGGSPSKENWMAVKKILRTLK
jgi:transglutaminase-like putative cysteine protease